MQPMNELTIQDTKKILGWSYPTALKFAKQNGRQDETGRWLIPAVVVREQLDAIHLRLAVMWREFNELAIPAASGEFHG